MSARARAARSRGDTQAIHLLIDRGHRFLKDDLLRRRGTHHLREISTVRVVPISTADIMQAQAQQKRLQAKLGILERQSRGIARPTEIVNGFILVGT